MTPPGSPLELLTGIRPALHKTARLLAKLASTRTRTIAAEAEGGISVGTEDLFEEEGRIRPWGIKWSRPSAFSIIFQALLATRQSDASVCSTRRRL